MPLWARLGDTSSHGGAIITSASRTLCEGALVAREGDILTCAIHGPVAIVGHSNKYKVEGKFVARHGDLAACGAALVSGATKSIDE